MVATKRMVVDIKKYTVGDRVELRDDKGRVTRATVTQVRETSLTLKRDDGVEGGGFERGWYFASDGSDGEILNKLSSKTFMSTLKSTWKRITRSEPEKTYIKAGILDDNEEFTAEGRDLFLSHLLQKNPEFKTVADQIVAEENK